MMTGGDRMAQRLREIAERIESGRSVKVGFLEGATYPDEAHTPVALVAVMLNYGTSKMPPRPFFTQMIADKRDGWGEKLAAVMRLNNYDASKSLGLMGEGIKGQLQAAIVAFDNPPDSAATMARKKAANGAKATLIDTGHMLRSVDWEVED